MIAKIQSEKDKKNCQHKHTLSSETSLVATSGGQKSYVSAMETTPRDFSLENWLEAFVSYVVALRKFPVLEENRKKYFLSELQRRNFNRDAAISAEIHLLTTQFSQSKIAHGFDISDFFPSTISITINEFNAQYRRGYKQAEMDTELRKSSNNNNIDVNIELLKRISELQEKVSEVNNARKVLISYLRRLFIRFEFRSDSELKNEIEAILQQNTDEMPFDFPGTTENDDGT